MNIFTLHKGITIKDKGLVVQYDSAQSQFILGTDFIFPLQELG